MNMAFINSLSKIAKTVSDQASVATKKANEALEIAKINSSIKSEQEKIEKIQAEIGKIVLNKFENGEDICPEAIESCKNINAIKELIETLNQKIVIIKNVKVCPNCKAEVVLNAPFCNKCGAKQELPVIQEDEVIVEKLTCPNCGAKITEETDFCSFCGTKIENSKNEGEI
jgi:ribosomal protein L40E